MKGFTELDAWKKSRILRNDIFELTKSFPGDEKYRLADQIIRSSRSIGNNIAEGHGRFHYADSSKFLINACGSAAETIDHLIIALDQNYISNEIFEKFKLQLEECLKLINGYINYLLKRVKTRKQQKTMWLLSK